MKFSTRALALASARHPWRTIATWSVTAVLAVAAITAFLGDLTPDGNPTNDPQSQRALEVEGRAFPPDRREDVTDLIVVRSDRYAVGSPQFRSFVERVVAETRATEAGASARSYLETGDRALVSRDRHATLIPLAVPEDGDVGALVNVVKSADQDRDFAASIAGTATLDNDFEKLSQEDLKNGELQFGLPAALLVLLLVFGTVVAGLVPLLMSSVAILVALALLGLLAQAFELSIFAINILTGMGLALGIDYALFAISRFREERGRGRERLDAIAQSGATANRAVLVSGTTFVVAMFGMLIVPNSIMRSIAAGAILVGIVSVAAGLTLLPALLGLLGDRVDSLRIPIVGRRSRAAANPEGRFWGAVVRRVLRRPALSLALAVVFLVAAAAPILAMEVGSNGVSTLPDRFESRRGFLALERDFPNMRTDPVEIVVDGASARQARQALARLRTQLAEDRRFGRGATRRSEDGEVAVLSVPVRGDAAGEGAVAAVRELRSDVVPAVFARTDAEVFVGGATSETIDYQSSVSDPAPAVFAFVLGLTLLLLTVVFRSVVVAGTAVVLNLLSVGAAYGLLVLVFQHGVGAAVSPS